MNPYVDDDPGSRHRSCVLVDQVCGLEKPLFNREKRGSSLPPLVILMWRTLPLYWGRWTLGSGIELCTGRLCLVIIQLSDGAKMKLEGEETIKRMIQIWITIDQVSNH